MSAIVTLQADPSEVENGRKTVFTGYVEYDGAPIDGLRTDIVHADDTRILTTYTDAYGYFRAEWTPPESLYDTSFEVRALAFMYEGYYSLPVTITMTPYVERPSMIPLLLLGGLVLLAMQKK